MQSKQKWDRGGKQSWQAAHIRLFSFQIKQNDLLNGQRSANLFTGRIYHKDEQKRFPGVYYQAVFFFFFFFFCSCDRLYSLSFYSICFLKTELKFHSIWPFYVSRVIKRTPTFVVKAIPKLPIETLLNELAVCAKSQPGNFAWNLGEKSYRLFPKTFPVSPFYDRSWSNRVIDCHTCLLTWPVFRDNIRQSNDK